jgi:alkanesulfonate monooxygenase SsuD/methylene tetrahydromethanopterin reductase-like flavin-dependent oxidoreductase (luciferase family)
MRYAINVPNFADYADPATFVHLAREAEDAGWDGLFVWDHILVARDGRMPIADPWILLAAAAAATSRIRLGPMVTPLPRRRPWVVARQIATLDHLSGGRVIFGAGLGHPPDAEFEAFGEDGSLRGRAESLDEGLAIVDGLLRGEPFAYEGRRFRLTEMTFLPQPVQRPRPPVWLGGYWPRRAPFRRAARWDGVAPGSLALSETAPHLPIPPDELRGVLDLIAEERGERGMDGFDVLVAGSTPDDRDATVEMLAPYAAMGVTWWSEGVNSWRGDVAQMQRLVAGGPPRAAIRR